MLSAPLWAYSEENLSFICSSEKPAGFSELLFSQEGLFRKAAFASQPGLRLKSPTGAFMPYGHRRTFWFSFAAKREHNPRPLCNFRLFTSL